MVEIPVLFQIIRCGDRPFKWQSQYKNRQIEGYLKTKTPISDLVYYQHACIRQPFDIQCGQGKSKVRESGD